MTDTARQALQVGQENAKDIAGIKAWMQGHDKLCEERTKNLQKGMNDVHKSINFLLKIVVWGGGAVLMLLITAIAFLLTHPEIGLKGAL